MSTAYLATVVVPTYERRELGLRLLEALARQTLPPHLFEVIVSIDGSEDGTREMVAGFPAPYALDGLWHPNQGRARARNAALRRAWGRVVVLLDDDMQPAPGFLAAHLAAHVGDERLGILGAAPVLVDPSAPPVVQYVGRKFNQHLARLAQQGQVLKLREFYSGNFSIRRELLSEVGLFDEDFKLYGNEDLELCVRLSQAGVRIAYSPDAVAYQTYSKDLASLARDNIAKGRTAVILAAKHPDVWADTKLGSYHQGARGWRLGRTMLLGLGRLLPDLPLRLIGPIAWLDRALPAHPETYYSLLLDYCFWSGVRMEMRRTDGPSHSQG